MNLRDFNPTVKPPVAQVEQLKHEIYTLGTSFRQVSSESGLSVDTVKSLIVGNNVEQATAARLESYLKALSRNEFYSTRSIRKHVAGEMSGQKMKLERTYYALNRELWREYKVTTMHPDKFAKLDRRHKIVRCNMEERRAKLALMSKHKPFIDQHRVWLVDGWTYWRWKYYLKKRMAAASGVV